MIHAENLTVKYNAKDEDAALRGISFSLRAGERLALAGANGAGKSTLLLTIMGIIPQAAGTLSVCGYQAVKENMERIRRQASLLFQNPDDQLFMPTVDEDIAFGPRNYGLDERTIAARAEKVLAELGISRLRFRLSHKLSGGEKRLAALAGTLMMEPALLLLDEPSSFLDPRSRRNLIRILSGLHQTMIIATHDIDLARSLCNRIILLKDGKIFAEGAADDILGNAPLLEECGL